MREPSANNRHTLPRCNTTQCKMEYDDDEPQQRACFAEQGDRQPQVGDDIAVTGFGGKCWYAGRIFAMHPAKRGKRNEPTYVSEVYYTNDKSKTDQVLSRKTYGPAQCRVGDVRVGSKTVKDSFTPGWVFLVPVADAGEATDAEAAAAMEEGEREGGEGGEGGESGEAQS